MALNWSPGLIVCASWCVGRARSIQGGPGDDCGSPVAALCQELIKTVQNLEEVNGGGKELNQHWYDCHSPPLDDNTAWTDIKKCAEETVCVAYGQAIRKRVGKLTLALQSVLIWARSGS